jgi:dihydrofolate synthase/folylpolyglutamate synthase
MIEKVDPIDFLYSLEKFGIKLGLNNTFMLLDYLNNPHNDFISIHVAGTNGKGSTSSFIASILQESGLKVGLYTSPHLINFTERIKINGKQIDHKILTKYIEILRDKIIQLKATFFEATTCIAFKYFSDESIDIAIVETGLGGRLDSTNVLSPILTIITDIGFDHIDQLGNSIKQITKEKSGILKESIECITATRNIEALNILKEEARLKNTRITSIDEISTFKIDSMRINRMDLSLSINEFKNVKISTPLIGKHQIYNTLLSIAAINYLNNSKNFKIPFEAIKIGLEKVIENAGLRCRIELFRKKPFLILDVAHNVDSILKLVETLSNFRFEKIILIFGVMKDKDYKGIIKILAQFINLCLAVKPKGERSLETSIIALEFNKYDIPVYAFQQMELAIEKALKVSKKNDLILVTGSHYVCGEILEILGKEKKLDNL